MIACFSKSLVNRTKLLFVPKRTFIDQLGLKSYKEADLAPLLNDKQGVFSLPEKLHFDDEDRYVVFDATQHSLKHRSGNLKYILTLTSYYLTGACYFAQPIETFYAMAGMSAILSGLTY